MSDEWQIVQENYTAVLNSFALTSSLESQLMEKGLVSFGDLQDIKAERTDNDQKTKLIWTYLSKRGPGSLAKFCDALKGANPPYNYLADLLRKAMKK